MTTPSVDIIFDTPILSVVWVGDGKSRTPAQKSTNQAFYRLPAGFTYTTQLNNLSAGKVNLYRARGAVWESRSLVASCEAGKTSIGQAIPVLPEEDVRIVLEFATNATTSERAEVMLIGRPIATA